MHGVKVGGSMGLTTWMAFSGGDAQAVVDGDFIMSAAEVQPVLRALRKARDLRLGQSRPGPGAARQRPALHMRAGRLEAGI